MKTEYSIDIKRAPWRRFFRKEMVRFMEYSMLNKALFFILFIVFARTAIADNNLNRNLFKCDSNGFYWGSCYLEGLDLLGKYPYLMNVKISLRNTTTVNRPNIGVKDSDNFYFFPTNKANSSIEFNTYGLVKTHDKSPKNTSGGMYLVDKPEVIIKTIEIDLADSSKQFLREIIEDIDNNASSFSSIKMIETTSNLLKLAFTQLDTRGLSMYLRQIYDTVKDSRQIHDTSDLYEGSAALEDIEDHILVKICTDSNLALLNEDICQQNKAQGNITTSLIETIEENLNSILEITKNLTKDRSDWVAKKFVKAWEIIKFASESSKKSFKHDLCKASHKSEYIPDECKNIGINDEN